MGVARLKKKTELNYRRGTTSRYCGHCNHCVAFQKADGSSKYFRCRIIGLESGRLYSIHPQNICDAWDDSRYMERLTGRKNP